MEWKVRKTEAFRRAERGRLRIRAQAVGRDTASSKVALALGRCPLHWPNAFAFMLDMIQGHCFREVFLRLISIDSTVEKKARSKWQTTSLTPYPLRLLAPFAICVISSSQGPRSGLSITIGNIGTGNHFGMMTIARILVHPHSVTIISSLLG